RLASSTTGPTQCGSRIPKADVAHSPPARAAQRVPVSYLKVAAFVSLFFNQAFERSHCEFGNCSRQTRQQVTQYQNDDRWGHLDDRVRRQILKGRSLKRGPLKRGSQ